jgi:cyclopropane fatty-acyl-phospholipid synthase-like methyltransferase
MLDLIKLKEDVRENITLLDFGCGAAHLMDYIREKKYSNIEYSGLDLSEKFIKLSKSKHPNVTFYQCDILIDDSVIPSFDYIIMNGVFTEKRNLSFDEMWEFFIRMLRAIFAKSNVGISLNVMSKAVEWERDDLFHLSIDKLVDFLTKNLSRNFIIRNDYGLYEYTTYIYK